MSQLMTAPVFTASPLDQIGQPFQFECMNPNPKANKLKDGMRYRLEVEVDAETFNAFAAANTTGMVLLGSLQVTELGSGSLG